jgi:hypothetical protein
LPERIDRLAQVLQHLMRGNGIERFRGETRDDVDSCLAATLCLAISPCFSDGGKRHLAGSSDAGMLDWTDEFWSEISERAKADKS